MSIEQENKSEDYNLDESMEVKELLKGEIEVSSELSEETKDDLSKASMFGLRGGQLTPELVEKYFYIPEDEIGNWEFTLLQLPKGDMTGELERILEKSGLEPAGLGHLDAFRQHNSIPEGKTIVGSRNEITYTNTIEERSGFPAYTSKFKQMEFSGWGTYILGGENDLVLAVRKQTPEQNSDPKENIAE